MRQLLYAVVPLIFDSLGVIVFAVLMAANVDLIIATAAGAITAVAVVAWEALRRRPVAAVQWLSLGLVFVSAAATLMTHDPRFVMVKPSVVYVRERGLLLFTATQAVTPGDCDKPRFHGRRETMTRTVGKPIGGALQPPFGLDHVAAGEPLFPAAIFAERDQLGRGLHRCHHLIELLLSVAVAVDEHREVATGERRLLPRDRIERDVRISAKCCSTCLALSPVRSAISA